MNQKSTASIWMMIVLLVFFVGMILNSIFGPGRESGESNSTQLRVEGFLDKNTQLTYFPQKVSTDSNSHITFGINDFTREAIEIPVCIKTYKELMKPLGDKDPPRTSPTQEYTTAITGLDIYKKYTNDIVAQSTEIMDKQYGDLFSMSVLSSISLNDFLDMVEKRMSTANRLHNFIKYSCILPFSAKYNFTEFSDYFGNLIYRYKSREMQLADIKKYMYSILSPADLHSKFIQHYKENQTIYPTKNDILYVLNATNEAMSKVNFETLKYNAETRNVYLFDKDESHKSDLSLTLESLTLFTVFWMSKNLYSLTVPGVCKYISMERGELRKVMMEYLVKKYPTIYPNTDTAKKSSSIIFLLDVNNDPNLPEPIVWES